MSLTSPTEETIWQWLSQDMRAKNGAYFRPTDDFWRPDTTTMSANIGGAKLSVPYEFQLWLVAALAIYAKEYSARSLKGLASILKVLSDEEFNILDKKSVIPINRRLRREEFSTLRAFISYWHNLNQLTIKPEKDLIATYYSVRLKPTGTCPVESVDPEKGPFTELETQAIFDWANNSYANAKISLERYIYIRLLISTGARQRQLQQLVFGDVALNSQGIPTVKTPKAKEKGLNTNFRTDFQDINISHDLYQAIICFRKITLSKVSAEKPEINWSSALNNLPVFPARGYTIGHSRYVVIDDPALLSLEDSPQENLHRQDSSMKNILTELAARDDFPISERTGKKIRIGPHRFRYTLGTDMARMGYGAHTIAAALDHKDTRSVGKYIKMSPSLGARIDNKLKQELALVVNAFTGRIVSGAEKAINGGDPNKTIRSENAIATCGALGNCHLDAPIACYLCSKFQPWKEAPHHEVLERLILRQQRIIEDEGESSPAAVNFERPILAVIQVMHQIAQDSQTDTK